MASALLKPIATSVPAGSKTRDRLPHGLRTADGLDHPGHAAAGDLQDPVDDVPVPRVHHVGGADPPGELELDRVEVDRDHRVGAGERGAHDGGEADAAGPENGERTAGRARARHSARPRRR